MGLVTQAMTIHRPEAAARALRAGGMLSACRLCAHACGADRRDPGVVARLPCRAGTAARIFHLGAEFAGEAALVPTAVVSFAGCNWRCRFCLTGGPSQDATRGESFDPDDAARRLLAQPGLRSLTILGGEPVIHLPAALALIARIPPELPVVWKTNASAGAEALDLLDGQVDLVLADLKFGSDVCARTLAGAAHQETVWTNLRWAAERGLLRVRHLLMPGHLECCTRPALERLARELPGTRISLMTGFLTTFRAAAWGSNRSEDLTAARALLAASGLRPEPWSVEVPSGTPSDSGENEVWIDPQGRISVDSASPAMLAALRRISPEVGP